MTAQEVLARQAERQTENLIYIASTIPSDKLDWVPGDGCRSALDQLRECATAVTFFWDIYTEYKLENIQDRFKGWMKARKELHTLDELTVALRESTQQLAALIRSAPEADLGRNVEMPWPGEYNLADVFHFHTWNMSYHEGQIAMIGFLLPKAE